MRIKTAKDFMKFLGSALAVAPKSGLVKNSPMEIVDSSKLRYHMDKDLYFIVNPGGTKQRDISRLAANYIDLDAGRDAKGNYFDMRTVNRKKAAMLKKISTFPLKPSAIVETRNGYQVYWKLVGTPNMAQYLPTWNKIQRSIYSFFHEVGADAKTIKVNQIMRLPFTTWYKQYEKKKPFQVNLHTFNEVGYTLTKMWDNTKNIPWVDRSLWNKFSPPNGSNAHRDRDFSTKKKRGNVVIDKGGPKSPYAWAELPPVSQHTTIADTVAFLNEIAKQLPYKGLTYSAMSASRLAERLTKEYL